MEIKTAHDFIKQCGKAHWAYDTEHYTFDDIERAMIRFAEYHVNLALQAAHKDAQAYYNEMKHWHSVDSITKAYPLDNIV